MITIIARKHLRYDAQGNDIARVYISVSSSSELPAQDGIPKIIIAEASKAWDVSTGDKYGFVVGQGWKKQATVINPMTLKGRVDSIEDLPENAEPGWVYFVGDPEEENLPEYMYTEDGKWDPIGTNSVQIVVDSALSTASENPVQNKVITNAMVGEKTASKQYVIDGQTVTAGDGAEAFNVYTGNSQNKPTGQYSHAEGANTIATGQCSHAEGAGTRATGGQAHAEGAGTRATGQYSHAEGASTQATGSGAHTEGSGAQATGDYAHAEGSGTTASGTGSHSEGGGTRAIGLNAHAEGAGTTAEGQSAHAEGGGCSAIGNYSHAEGCGTYAHFAYSHTEGESTLAESTHQHVQGKYNSADANGVYAFIIGNGTAYNARHNAFAIDWNGNIYVNGSATGVNVETLSSILTPISESAYEALTTKDKPLYFIYD